MPIHRDEQERLLMAELEKRSHERFAAEDRIMNPAGSRTVADQRGLLDARDLARKNYDKAHAALGAYRESLRKNL